MKQKKSTNIKDMGSTYLFWLSSTILSTALYKLGESFEGSLAVVINNLLATFREELESREALNFDLFYFVGCGIHLGNDEVISVLEFLC